VNIFIMCRWHTYKLIYHSNWWQYFVVTPNIENYLNQCWKWMCKEQCHDKTNIMGLWPAWIQTSLRIRAVW
jgi:hypothetical protein